jgi:hypothetical protein
MIAHQNDWRRLAEEASKEKDSQKLIALVTELCRALGSQMSFPSPTAT